MLPMLLSVIRVCGSSLFPRFRDGDYVLVSAIPILFARLRPGDVIVFKHPSLGKLIKIIERLEDGGSRVYVTGLDDASRDSRVFGAVPRSLVLGKAIWHIGKK
jgi:nickel-type superoxide dismutase maturation protease